MPAKPAQSPAPGQKVALDTTRVKSNIPKGGEGEGTTWEYPSPQMFWNAMVRKGKKGDSEESDMEYVVAIHNNMNEVTWGQVLEWEALHQDVYQAKMNANADAEAGAGPGSGVAAEPKLLRFTGRPDENSPKARMKMFIGCPAPFDRHDWVVDRAGEEVRYVIDYYHDDDGKDKDTLPGLRDKDTIQSIKIDVRPALDSFGAFLDRAAFMPLAFMRGLTDFEYLPFNRPTGGTLFNTYNPHAVQFPTPAKDAVEKPSFLTDTADFPPDLAALRAVETQVVQSCALSKQAMDACKSDAECNQASIAHLYCMATLLCKRDAMVFEKTMQGGGKEEEAEKAFRAVEACMGKFEQHTRALLASAEQARK